MSKWPMRGHFRHLHFKTFPMTPRTPQCKLFCPLLLNSKHSRVPEDSKPPTLGVGVSSSHFTQSGVATGLNFYSRTSVFIFAIFAFLMFSPCVTFIAMKFKNMIPLWPSLKSHFYYEWKTHAKINIMILWFKTYFLWFRSMPKTNRLIL
jgi:hypothetical protein